MSKEKIIILDLESLKDIEDKNSLYRDLLYLDTNISTPALKALSQDLDTKEDLTLEERAYHIDALFDNLKELASRDSAYGIKNAYAQYMESIEQNPDHTLEAQQKFVDYCAQKIPFNGNNIEKVCAIALQKLLTKSSTIQECKSTLNEALTTYTETCKEQCAQDFDRNHLHMSTDFSTDRLYKADDLPDTLTGEQKEFVSTMLDQGKFVGGQFNPLQNDMASSGVILDFNKQNHTVPRTLIQKTDGRIYCISTFQINKIDPEQIDPIVPIGTIQTIVDITDLQSKHFIPGMASAKVKTQIIITGNDKELSKLHIPVEFKDRQLSDKERKITEQTSLFLPKAIDQYLKNNLKASETLTNEKENELSEGIIKIAMSISHSNETFKDELQKESGSIVRKYAANQKNKFSTIENIKWIYSEYIEPIFYSKKTENKLVEYIKETAIKYLTSKSDRPTPPPYKIVTKIKDEKSIG